MGKIQQQRLWRRFLPMQLKHHQPYRISCIRGGYRIIEFWMQAFWGQPGFVQCSAWNTGYNKVEIPITYVQLSLLGMATNIAWHMMTIGSLLFLASSSTFKILMCLNWQLWEIPTDDCLFSWLLIDEGHQLKVFKNSATQNLDPFFFALMCELWSRSEKESCDQGTFQALSWGCWCMSLKIFYASSPIDLCVPCGFDSPARWDFLSRQSVSW